MKQKLFFRIGVFVALLSVGVGIGLAAKFAMATASGNTSGWAWGGGVTENPYGYEGIGWISFNDTNIGSGGGTYGVNIPSGDGPVTGYAWWGHGNNSVDGDWLDFQPVGPYPENPDHGVRRSGNNLIGWARFVGIKQAMESGNGGGFDGWVKMHNVTIDSSTGSLSGFAWSSDLGWINFYGVKIGENMDPTLEVCVNGAHIASGNETSIRALVNDSFEDLRVFYDDTPGDCQSDAGSIAQQPGVVTNDETNNTITITEQGTDAIRVTGHNNGASPLSERVTVSYRGSTIYLDYRVLITLASVCGDGILGSGEACDDGSSSNGECPRDCSATCTKNNCNSSTTWKEVAP